MKHGLGLECSHSGRCPIFSALPALEERYAQLGNFRTLRLGGVDPFAHPRTRHDLYIATRSVAQGQRAGLDSLLDIYAGTLIHAGAAILGLSALIAASASALSLVKYVGAAYLLYLGVRTFLSQAEPRLAGDTAPEKLRSIFYKGLFVNILNPKVILFFIAFLPQFIEPARGNVHLQLIFLNLLFIAITLPANLAVSLAGGWLGAWLRAKRGLQQASKWISGSVYIALGLTTALTGTRKS